MTLMEKLFEKHMLINKVKELQKENAELRECLREAIVEMCHAYCEQYESCKKKDGECFVQEWRKALSKASGEEVR